MKLEAKTLIAFYRQAQLSGFAEERRRNGGLVRLLIMLRIEFPSSINRIADFKALGAASS